MVGNSVIPSDMKFHPDDQDTGNGTILAGIGWVPARATGFRPTVVPAGTQFYDTTLGKLLVFSGSSWLNLDGTEVQ